MKKTLFDILLGSSFILFPSSFLLQGSPGIRLTPDEEKRSAIFDDHGYAYLAEGTRSETFAACLAQISIDCFTGDHSRARALCLPRRERSWQLERRSGVSFSVFPRLSVSF
jgi:hypothetical protein